MRGTSAASNQAGLIGIALDKLIRPWITVLMTGTLFAAVVLVRIGDLSVMGAALFSLATAIAAIVARWTLRRMRAASERATFRAAEQILLDGIRETVEGLQTQKAALRPK
jgi:hypothetical protein